ncbi:DNA-binding transcriptional regulator, MerR family [Sinosporangium album]|uniref:DNA-binding transcriptional regulator, MerR family n=1 Tax=Sinosporangium album TaxID=504805 RepID=A0A1G8GAX6_9ACTN|nr:DNA-binding transcriptional regulator, MerR family [Sinosporangium album]
MSRERTTLRPVDLARLVGVSTQQIRNYVDESVLPPTARTAAGYRVFHARHRQALLTYRTLAKGYGWDPAKAIMQAVHAGDLAEALTLVDTAHAALHEQRLSLRAAGTALEAVAEQNPDASALPRYDMRIGDAAAHLGVRTSALRVWEAVGLLSPARDPATRYRSYNATDIRDARMISMLRQGRYAFPQIQVILDGLRRTGSSDALRAAIAQRQAELTQRATAMLEGASHLHHYTTADHTP